MDLKGEGLPVITEKTVAPDGCAILLDLDRVTGVRILGTSARVENWAEEEDSLRFTLRTADKIRSHTRILLEKAPKEVTFSGTWGWDEGSSSILLTYDSDGTTVAVSMTF